MKKVGKISLKVLEKSDALGDSYLKFKMEGDDINFVVANTIRRTTQDDIPIYAYNIFKFEKNSAVLHNDYIKNRLRFLPVWNIENKLDFFDTTEQKEEKEEIDNDNDEYDGVEIETTKPVNVSSLKQMTLYVNFKNKTNEIVNVTTDDAKFYYEEKQITSPYKVAVPLARLQPNQEIAFSAITTVGTEHMNAMYSAVCISAYKQLSETEFEFNIESRGQITEKRILQVALMCINMRLKNFLKVLKDDTTVIDEEKNEGIIIINNEDHTLGNLISHGMTKHKNISFAGYNLTHPRVAKVNFHYKHDKGAKIVKIIEDVVDYYLELFSDIKKQVDKI